MSTLAPLLEGFFTERLLQQRQASPNTVAAYRDTFRLLLGYAHRKLGKQPTGLTLGQLDAPFIGAFLEHLEKQRGNCVRTRNARLAAIHSFFRYAALREPSCAALIQRVLAIPHKRFERALVTFLTRPEMDALLAAPDRSTWLGHRDYALMLVAVQTGLRVSELTQLRREDVELGTGAHVRCHGKGRKERCTPLIAQTVAVLRSWLRERQGRPGDALFPSRRGGALSRDAVERLVAKYAQRASRNCPSLRGKRVTPHVLRHTNAMELRHAGVDRSVIALLLGHESIETTQIYLHADLSMKQRALDRTAPRHASAKRYKPPDRLMAFLEGL